MISCLSACSGEFDKLDQVDIDSQVISVTILQDALIAISQQRMYILQGQYRVFISGKELTIPAGIAIDNGTYSLHKFSIEEFSNLYKNKFPPNY